MSPEELKKYQEDMMKMYQEFGYIVVGDYDDDKLGEEGLDFLGIPGIPYIVSEGTTYEDALAQKNRLEEISGHDCVPPPQDCHYYRTKMVKQ